MVFPIESYSLDALSSRSSHLRCSCSICQPVVWFTEGRAVLLSVGAYGLGFVVALLFGVTYLHWGD